MAGLADRLAIHQGYGGQPRHLRMGAGGGQGLGNQGFEFGTGEGFRHRDEYGPLQQAFPSG